MLDVEGLLVVLVVVERPQTRNELPWPTHSNSGFDSVCYSKVLVMKIRQLKSITFEKSHVTLESSFLLNLEFTIVMVQNID